MTIWNGTWDTNYKEIVLTQTGDNVAGTYSNVGIINGYNHETGGVHTLKGTFTNNNRKGDFEFIYNDDEFSGNWKWSNSTNWDGTWTGKKRSTPQPIGYTFKKELIDGIFEGGGTLGTAYVGVTRALSDRNIWFKTVSGNSAGAITAALISSGYNASELHWLSAPNTTNKPQSLNGIDPIVFSDFLDVTENSDQISDTNMRRTALWKALKGEALDNILKIKITTIPSRSSAAESVTNGLLAIPILRRLLPRHEDLIEDKMKSLLLFLPETTRSPTLKDFSFFNTERLRIKFADAVWKKFANSNVSYRLLVNLIYEGGICEGEVFESTISKLLSAKKFGVGSNQTVKFSDLSIPLVLIAADTKRKNMVVYSSKSTPDKSVAEAVRESMSIPFLFEPVGNREMVDGGICSNYPYWVYSEGLANDYFDSSYIDSDRIKIGFTLDKYGDPNGQWNTNDSKYTSNSSTRSRNPSSFEVLSKNILLSHGIEISDNSEFGDIFKFLNNVMETSGTDHLHGKISEKVMKGTVFYEVNVPVKGYHWLDFHISESTEDFNGIAQRGWYSTMDLLERHNIVGSLTTYPTIPKTCPF